MFASLMWVVENCLYSIASDIRYVFIKCYTCYVKIVNQHCSHHPKLALKVAEAISFFLGCSCFWPV